MGRPLPIGSLPAVLPATALALGVLSASGPGLRFLWVGAGAGALASACVSRQATRVGILLFAAALGGFSGASERRRGEERIRGWIPEPGTVYEGRLVGVVLRAPERGEAGERRLPIASRPFPDPAPGAPPARLGLIVPAGAPEDVRRIDALRAGDAIELWARVASPRGRSAAGVDATARVKSARLVERRLAGGGSFADRVLVASRARLDRAVGPDDPVRGLLGAMLLGDRASLDAATGAALRASGLYHLVAISGLHTGFVVAAILGLSIPLRLRGRRAALVAGLAIALFAAVTGGAPPVARAAGAASLALVGRAIGTEGDPRNTLAIVAAGILLLKPAWIGHAGFLLSVAAVAAILTLAPPASRGIPLPAPAAKGLAISLAAYVGTAPLLASTFGRLSPVALLANLAGVPLAAAVVGSGFACIVLADVPVLGSIAAASAEGSIALLVGIADLSAALPFATVRVPPPSSALLGIFAASAALLATAPRKRVAARRGATAALAFTLAALHLGPLPGSRTGPALAILDVGQGLSVAVLSRDGTCALVDAGGTSGGRFDAGERIVVPRLLAEGCRRIDPLVVSHGHDDHAGGLAAVVDGLDVGEVWIPVGATRDDGLRGAVAASGVALRLVERGAERRVGAWRVRVLHPSRDDRILPINDRSLALLLEGPEGARALLPGDLESRGERVLLARNAVPHAEVLVAGHHGARGSSGSRWLSAIGPKFAVVSAGPGNRFGHPHEEALRRLRDAGAPVYRTDRDGEVLLRPSPGGWRVTVTARRTGTERE